VPDNGIGLKGIGRNFISVVPVNITDENCMPTFESARVGIEWAAQYTKVLNISWEYPYNEFVEWAIWGAKDSGSIIVAASGNSSQPDVLFPARVRAAVAVGGTDKADYRWQDLIGGGGSNYGNALDLVAPGVDIYTTDLMDDAGDNPFGNYSLCVLHLTCNGTSYATPEVSAVAALMLLVDPSLTPDQLQDILQRTAIEVNPGKYSFSSRVDEGGWNNEVGFGRLDAYEAVRTVKYPPSLSFRVRLERILDEHHSRDVAIAIYGQDENIIFYEIVTTDDSGNSSEYVSLHGIASGNYTICAKPRHYLGRCVSTSLSIGQNTYIDFSEGDNYLFVSGDFNIGGEDGVINSMDWAKYISLYLPCLTLPATGICEDLDLLPDGVINSGDSIVLRMNIGKVSDGEYPFYWRPFVTLPESILEIETTTSLTAGLWFESAQSDAYIGIPFDLDIWMDLSSSLSGAEAANLIVHYDPGVLDVIDANPDVPGIQITPGTLFPSNDQGVVDPIKGEIRINSYASPVEGVNGIDRLATIKFLPIAGVANTVISAEWLADETLDSNAAERDSGLDIIAYAEDFNIVVNGSPTRILPYVTISVPQTTSIGTYDTNIKVEAYDPYGQVQAVQVHVYYDEEWHYVGDDNQSEDGWVVQWDSTGVSDQLVHFYAFAFLPGYEYGEGGLYDIYLDRTEPIYIAHWFYPLPPAWPSVVEVDVYAVDNMSGVSSIQMFVNDAIDGSESGTWIFIGDVAGEFGTITWNTTDMAIGSHQVAFAIQDNAGNWNRWSDETLPTIIYSAPKVYLPMLFNK
jgi:hypothetical protein